MRIRSLYLNIYLTVVTVLLVFALVAGVMVRRHGEAERVRIEAAMAERSAAWAGLIEKSLPPATADAAEQRAALVEAGERLHTELALETADGRRLAATMYFDADVSRPDRRGPPTTRVRFADGRVLVVMPPRPPWGRDRDRERGRDRARDQDGARPGHPQPGEGRLADREASGPPEGGPPSWKSFGPREPHVHGPGGERLPLGSPWAWVRGWFDEGLILLGVLFVAIAAGSYPVVRRLTRRLEALRRGVEAFGAGALDYRVPVQGSDEVSAVATSFNQAAQRVEDLVRANRSLLANASHELRSPLARMKMAVSMLESSAEADRPALREEIDRDIRELDALVEEVLLASRLDAQAAMADDPVDVPAVVAEEAARIGAEVDVSSAAVQARLAGDERLLRRAVRNLLENARRYGGDEVLAEVSASEQGMTVRVCDRGPGVPDDQRERIFEPFYRLPGHSERAGGVGLGLSLVRQIAQRHGGSVRCERREGGGSCFVLWVPLKR